MIPPSAERSLQIETVDALCLRLFDMWCESRSVTPLGYLMHCWPLRPQSDERLQRLQDTLKDLRDFHREQLDSRALSLLDQLFDCLGAVTEHAGTEPTARLQLVG
jgi:hypothetical protein